MSIKQLLRRTKQRSRVEVVWKDIRSHQGWAFVADLHDDDDNLSTIHSVGYFYSYVNNVLTLAMSWDQDEEFVGDRLCIPVDVIESVKVV